MWVPTPPMAARAVLPARGPGRARRAADPPRPHSAQLAQEQPDGDRPPTGKSVECIVKLRVGPEHRSEERHAAVELDGHCLGETLQAGRSAEVVAGVAPSSSSETSSSHSRCRACSIVVIPAASRARRVRSATVTEIRVPNRVAATNQRSTCASPASMSMPSSDGYRPPRDSTRLRATSTADAEPCVAFTGGDRGTAARASRRGCSERGDARSADGHHAVRGPSSPRPSSDPPDVDGVRVRDERHHAGRRHCAQQSHLRRGAASRPTGGARSSRRLSSVRPSPIRVRRRCAHRCAHRGAG